MWMFYLVALDILVNLLMTPVYQLRTIHEDPDKRKIICQTPPGSVDLNPAPYQRHQPAKKRDAF